MGRKERVKFNPRFFSLEGPQKFRSYSSDIPYIQLIGSLSRFSWHLQP